MLAPSSNRVRRSPALHAHQANGVGHEDCAVIDPRFDQNNVAVEDAGNIQEDDAHAAELAALSSTVSSTALQGKETVLVVEDEPMTRRVLVRVLLELGYRVLEASGTVEAQRLAGAQKVDLLLMDSTTLETSDLEMVLWFSTIYPKTKVLVASGALWDLSYRIGGSKQIAFLPKPYTPLELAQMIRRIFK